MQTHSTRRAVFLDRDGVILRALVRGGKPYPPATLGEAEILPGVEDALGCLAAAGYLLIVVTNQPDVARGALSHEAVEEVHAWLRTRLPIDDIRACCHDDADACRCRKPEPGLLMEAAAARHVDLQASVMIGDRWRDVEAGRRAGCATVFIDYGYDEVHPEHPDKVVSSLPEAVAWILARKGRT